MSDWISSTIAGAFDILGGGLNAAYSADSSSKAYKRQRRLMQMQQAWQERMSNTAHQREVKDLRDAGLNPILSATGGNGASSPVVSAPSVASASGNPFAFNNLGKTLANAAEVKQARTAEKLAEVRMKNEDRIASSQVEKNSAEAKYLEQQTRNLKASEGNLKGPFGMEYRGEGLQAIADYMSDAWDAITSHSPDAIRAKIQRTAPVRAVNRNVYKRMRELSDVPKNFFNALDRTLRFLPAIRPFLRSAAPWRDEPDLLKGQFRLRFKK